MHILVDLEFWKCHFLPQKYGTVAMETEKIGYYGNMGLVSLNKCKI